MLTRLILLNACSCPYAVIRLDDVDNIQLVGNNNVGKSSVIHALNFLFLGKQQREFSGNRKGTSPETLNYYFPQPEASYLAFEYRTVSDRTYTLLCWRSLNDSKEDWMRIDGAYNEDYFLESTTEVSSMASKRLRKLTEVKQLLVANNIDVKPLKKSTDVRAAVFSAQTHEHPVVKLRKQTTKDAISKLYYYLLNTRHITADGLKDIVLIADSNAETSLKYDEQHIEEIERVRRLKKELGKLEQARDLFSRFRNNLRDYNSQLGILKNSQAQFATDLKFWRKQTKEEGKVAQEALPALIAKLSDVKKAYEQTIDNRATVKAKRGANEEARKNLENKLKRLDDWSQQLLKQEQLGLKEQINSHQVALANLKNDGRSESEIEFYLNSTSKKLKNKKQQLADQNNWLIAKLSPRLAQQAEAILHEDLARSTTALFLKMPSSLDSPLTLGDGKLELPTGFAQRPNTESIEQLKSDIAELTHELKRLEKLVDTIKRREELKTKLQKLESNLTDVNSKLQQLDERPKQLEELDELNVRFADLELQLKKVTSEKKMLEEKRESAYKKVRIKERELESLHNQLNQIDNILGDVERWYVEGVSKNAGKVGIPSVTEIERTFHGLERTHDKLQKELNSLELDARTLRERTSAECVELDALIDELEEMYDAAEGQRATYQTAEDALIKQLATPADNLLSDFDRFQHYITNTFNRALKKIQVSDLEDLKLELEPSRQLHSDLKAIKALNDTANDLFSANERNDSRGLDLVKYYVTNHKSISLAELFDLHLNITRDGKPQRVDLNKQVESEGTNKLLRLVLALTAAKQLLDGSSTERLAIFLDEVATLDDRNRPALARFCTEHHFMPIFAAPKAVDGFERWIYLYREDGHLHLQESTRQRV